MKLPEKFTSELEPHPENMYGALRVKINEILDFLKERDAVNLLTGEEGEKPVDMKVGYGRSQEPPKEKEGYFMGIDSICVVCKERYCKCPERQQDGSWSPKEKECKYCRKTHGGFVCKEYVNAVSKPELNVEVCKYCGK